MTTFLLLQHDPWNTPRIFTWLSGTTYGRTFSDVVPVLAVSAVAAPLLWSMHRDLDLMAVDDDTPRILGLRVERTALVLLSTAAVLAAVAVVAVGTVGFVGLVAPHLARSLVCTARTCHPGIDGARCSTRGSAGHPRSVRSSPCPRSRWD